VNHSTHGIETTRAAIPSLREQLTCPSAICTSLPVAMRITAGSPPAASAST
jgi:hypothetical protein